MTDRTFHLSTETTELPLVVTEVALADFREQGLKAMDECLERISDRMNPVNAHSSKVAPQDMIGQMMLDGVASGNMRKVILCALWLAHHHPNFTGLVSDGAKFHFVRDESDVMAQQFFACA